MAKELTITSQNAKATAGTLWQWVKEALAGGAVTVEVRRPSKTREQEKHYHALIQEICAHASKHSQIKTDPEGWKAILVYEFEKEKAAMNEPLKNRGYYVIAKDGERIYIRPSTTLFRKKEGQEFIEFLYARGIDFGVQWSASAEQIKAAHGLGFG